LAAPQVGHGIASSSASKLGSFLFFLMAEKIMRHIRRTGLVNYDHLQNKLQAKKVAALTKANAVVCSPL
jgi:hypothetical protein